MKHKTIDPGWSWTKKLGVAAGIRRGSTLSDLVMSPTAVEFAARTAWPDGMIVKLQIGCATIHQVRCDRREIAYEIRAEFGGTWLYLPLAQGEHHIQVQMQSSQNL